MIGQRRARRRAVARQREARRAPDGLLGADHGDRDDRHARSRSRRAARSARVKRRHAVRLRQAPRDRLAAPRAEDDSGLARARAGAREPDPPRASPRPSAVADERAGPSSHFVDERLTGTATTGSPRDGRHARAKIVRQERRTSRGSRRPAPVPAGSRSRPTTSIAPPPAAERRRATSRRRRLDREPRRLRSRATRGRARSRARAPVDRRCSTLTVPGARDALSAPSASSSTCVARSAARRRATSPVGDGVAARRPTRARERPRIGATRGADSGGPIALARRRASVAGAPSACRTSTAERRSAAAAGRRPTSHDDLAARSGGELAPRRRREGRGLHEHAQETQVDAARSTAFATARCPRPFGRA